MTTATCVAVGDGWGVSVGAAEGVDWGKGVAETGPEVTEGSGGGNCVWVADGCSGVWLAVAEGSSVGRGELVAGAVEVAVDGATGVVVEVGVGGIVAVALAVGEGSGVCVGNTVGVKLGDGVAVAVGVELGNGVAVAVGSGVGVKVAVAATGTDTGPAKALPPLADRSSNL
jgi:hypothetical protein